MPVMTVFQERIAVVPATRPPALYAGGEGKGAPLIGVRLPPDELAAVDDWLSGQREPLSRPEAIRRLIKIALKKPRKS